MLMDETFLLVFSALQVRDCSISFWYTDDS